MRPAIMLCIGLSVAMTSLAQAARQGKEKADPTEFHSPMVWEADFIAAKPSLWQEADSEKWVQIPEYNLIRQYHCDGVSILFLRLSPKKIANDRIETRIQVAVANTGHDKQVKLLFELFNGDAEIAESVLGPFKDKEGATVTHIVPIVASRADLMVDPLTKLRITMTNWDY